MSIQFSATHHLGPFEYAAEFAADREIIVLFGHSGAGKSVTLQLVAGLMKPASGRISIDDRVVFDADALINLAPQERGVGYVVQDLALFPHMTVAENIAFGIPPGRDRTARVAELLALLRLDGMAERRPRTLSGGQQQRVALARALGRDARILLLDEPFSALDDSLRTGLRRELLRLKEQLGLTILFVTHDLREAHLLADRIAVFDAGRVLQYGPRDDVFRRPASRRVGELTGVANIWAAVVREASDSEVVVEASGAILHCVSPGRTFALGEAVDVLVRAERINLRRETHAPVDQNQFAMTIAEEYAYGSSHVLRLRPASVGPEMEVEIAARPYEVLNIAARRDWTVEIAPADLHVVPAAG